MLFRSRFPDIDFPTHLTVWEWAFEDAGHSQLYKNPRQQIAGYTDAATGERLDFFQLKEHATHLSTALVKNHGLQPGDTVTVLCPNSIWYPVCMYAVLRVGGRHNGASPDYTVDEMTHALKTAETRLIITVPQSMGVCLEAAKNAGIPPANIFMLQGSLAGYTTVRDLIDTGASCGSQGQVPAFRVPAGKTNDICGYLNFSSGTTGLPKAVMLSHKNIIAQCLQLQGVTSPGKRRYLASLPLYHISGLLRFLNYPVASNDECVMLPKFSIEAFLQAAVDHQITDFQIVPSIAIRLVRDPVVDNYDLRGVKYISCGAAPLGPAITALLAKKMPWAGFRQSYGLTESGCCLTSQPPEYYSYDYAHMSGILLASTELKVVDVVTGKALGVDGVGEIWARGPQIAMGYLNNAAATAETFGADGYLRTGDIGRVDRDGFISIVDRIKELIKVRGQQVAPAELEALLLEHPSVSDCAVLGIPDDYSIEKPKAYVVLKSSVPVGDAAGRDILDFVKARRSRYKWIKEIEFICKIPKSPSGKILRRILREQSDGQGHVVREAATYAKL